MSKSPNPFARGGQRKNKYGARPTGGHASCREHRRAAELKIRQRAGLISDLREQVPFLLIPAQYAELPPPPSPTGAAGLSKVAPAAPKKVCIERACKYIADFVYRDLATGETIVEDTKGVRTDAYIIKRKLMLHVHGIRIREI